jgi:hypothetical protein
VSPHFGDAIVSAATFFRSSPNDRKQSALTLLLQFAGRESPRPTSPTLKALHESKTGPSVRSVVGENRIRVGALAKRSLLGAATGLCISERSQGGDCRGTSIFRPHVFSAYCRKPLMSSDSREAAPAAEW